MSAAHSHSQPDPHYIEPRLVSIPAAWFLMGSLPVRIANVPFTASGLTLSNSPPPKSPTQNTQLTCAPPDCRRRHSGTTQISIIPNSLSSASPGSKPTTIANGCPRKPDARIVFPPKPNGSAPLAAISNRKISPGATILRNHFPTMPLAGKPDPSPSPSTLQIPSAFTTSATTSTSGAATGTIPTTTPPRPTAIPAAPILAPEPANANPPAADPGAITSKSRAAPPAPASLPNFNTPTTASASPAILYPAAYNFAHSDSCTIALSPYNCVIPNRATAR